METYYQESGRAGRDGLPSECLLFFRSADMPRQSSMVFHENSGLQNLYDIVQYCQSKRQCRRSAFFRHFAEPLQECNGMCDSCAFSSEIKEVDASGHSKLLISLVREMQEKDQRVTMLQLVDRVKNKQKQLDFELKREEMEQLVVQLILDRVLKEEFQHTAYATNSYVTVGPRANQVLQGKKIIKMDVTSTSKDVDGYRKSSKHGVTSGLEFKLDELRKELASHDKEIFPHSVLSGQQISSISAHLPNSIEELEKIIGKLKTEKYGGRILEEVKKYGNAEHPNNEVLNEEESSEIRPPRKKLKKANKQVIMVDSSNDESD